MKWAVLLLLFWVHVLWLLILAPLENGNEELVLAQASLYQLHYQSHKFSQEILSLFDEAGHLVK